MQAPRRWLGLIVAGAAALTVMWLIVAFAYVSVSIGWGSLADIGPQDLGAGIAGVVGPPILIWIAVFALLLVVVVERRGVRPQHLPPST